MAWGWSKTRYSPIAVDFGADSLKLLQIIPSDPPQMVAAASVDLPEHVRLDPESRHAFFSQALKDLVASHSFKGRRVICSVPAYQTLVQHLQVTRADDQAGVDAQVHQHLRQRLNVDPSRMVVRHFQVGQVIRDGATKREVICLAVSHDVAMKYIQIAQRARLNVVGMHSEPLAILQAFSHLHLSDGDAGHVVCFIDLGSATTKVVMTHGVDIGFAKTIHVAGDHFTRHVAKATGVTFSEARQARIQQAATKVGVEATEPETSASEPVGVVGSIQAADGPHLDAAVTEVSAKSAVDLSPTSVGVPAAAGHHDLGETLDCLLDELLLCIRYHQSTFPDRQIDKLIFLGGESRHVWMCQKIARTLRIGAQLGDPMARLVRVSQNKGSVGVDMRHRQPGWTVPVGLCLSEANL